jgi:hypothetical protein
MVNVPWPRWLRAWPVVLACCSLSGCCTLARLFCGPDTSPWVHRSFRTSREALATFLEAVRREDKGVIYECLGDRLKESLGLTGRIEVDFAYEKLKEQVTGLHLLGYARVEKVMGGTERGTRRGAVEYVIEAEGQRLVATFGEYTWWTVWVDEVDEDGERKPQPYGGSMPGLERSVGIDPERGMLRLQITSSSLPTTTEEHLREVAVGIEWKLDGLRGLEP